MQTDVIYDEMEFQWYLISAGNIENANINKILYKYKEKWNDVSCKHLCYDALSDDGRIKNRANLLKNEYYYNLFEGDANYEDQQQTDRITNAYTASKVMVITNT